MRPDWSGVFPAVTTQFRDDLSLDIDATARVIERLISDGVSGLIVCGTVGENCSLTKSEKIENILRSMESPLISQLVSDCLLLL